MKSYFFTEHFEISFSSTFNRTDVLRSKVFFLKKNLPLGTRTKYILRLEKLFSEFLHKVEIEKISTINLFLTSSK